MRTKTLFLANILHTSTVGKLAKFSCTILFWFLALRICRICYVIENARILQAKNQNKIGHENFARFTCLLITAVLWRKPLISEECCITLSDYAYLTSDTIESLANRTFEGIDIVCDETKTLTIWSLAMEWIFITDLSFFQRFLLMFFIQFWRYKLKKKI